MLDRPREQASSDRVTAETRNDGEPTVRRPATSSTSTDQHAPRAIAVAISASPDSQKRFNGSSRTMELPPLPHVSSMTGVAFSPASRSAGVTSILNPAAPDEGLPSRRRKASQLDSPVSGHPILPPLSTSTATGGFRSSSPMTLPSSISDRSSRKILTPRSPSQQHHHPILNQLNPPTGSINAQQSPFPTSPRARAYGLELNNNGLPPAPTPPAGHRQSYGFPAPTPPSQSIRRTSSATNLGARPASESTSPRSSYSSYSQAGQTSPGSQYASSTMPTLSAPYTDHGHERQQPIGVPISSSSGGQNVYQIMTLETTSGTVQLPVDVQAASRVADEKRRRNAGASARFRQRRKEKEREASTMISRLEQEVKEIREDMDFYKRERDYLAGVVLQAPGGDRHFPRPKSPFHFRNSSAMTGPSAQSSAGCVPAQAQAPRSPSDGRNVRRRTSGMSLPPPPQVQAPMPAPGGPYQPNYAPSSFAQPLAPQPPQSSHHNQGPLPPSLGRPTFPQSLPAPHQLMQAAPQTGPWNPYASSERRSNAQIN